MLRDNIIAQTAEILGLQSPYTITIHSGIYKGELKPADGIYSAIYSRVKRKLRHDIHVYLGDNTRSLETLIVHEMIHAWQEENGLTENHGKYFKLLAAELESLFGLTDIYIKKVDKKN